MTVTASKTARGAGNRNTTKTKAVGAATKLREQCEKLWHDTKVRSPNGPNRWMIGGHELRGSIVEGDLFYKPTSKYLNLPPKRQRRK